MMTCLSLFESKCRLCGADGRFFSQHWKTGGGPSKVWITWEFTFWLSSSAAIYMYIYIHVVKRNSIQVFMFFVSHQKFFFVLHSRFTHDLGSVNETLGCTHASDSSTCSIPKSSSAFLGCIYYTTTHDGTAKAEATFWWKQIVTKFVHQLLELTAN
mgnify:CR=1 FL=1